MVLHMYETQYYKYSNIALNTGKRQRQKIFIWLAYHIVWEMSWYHKTWIEKWYIWLATNMKRHIHTHNHSSHKILRIDNLWYALIGSKNFWDWRRRNEMWEEEEYQRWCIQNQHQEKTVQIFLILKGVHALRCN